MSHGNGSSQGKRQKKQHSNNEKIYEKRIRSGYGRYIVPGAIGTVVILLIPFIANIWISLHSWRGGRSKMKFIGLDNYVKLLGDEKFWTSFSNSLYMIVAMVIIPLLIGLILAAVFCVVTVLNINTGNVHIPVPKILRILFLKEGAATEYNIIWKIRLPRILMAALLGGALSLSGFLLQTFFSNPIAGPFVLGISSGAKMVVALTMIVYLKYIGRFSSYTLILAAFIGSLISTGFILLMSKKVQHM